MKKGLKKVLVLVMAVAMLAGSVFTSLAAESTLFTFYDTNNDNAPVATGVIKGELTVQSAQTVAPTGFVVDKVVATKDAAYGRFVPANKNIAIKFMSNGTTVAVERYVTLAEGEEMILDPVKMTAMLSGTGYELSDKNASVTVKYAYSEVRVLVNKIETPETPAPANKNIAIKFMSNGTTVAVERYVTLAEGEEIVLDPVKMTAMLSGTGYELSDKNASVTVKYAYNEVRVLVNKIETPETPAPANKNIAIKFMSNGTDVAVERYVTLAEGEEIVLDPVKMTAMLSGTGYELSDKNASVTVKYTYNEVRVLVNKVEVPAPGNKNVAIKFMTNGTNVVGTRYVTVAEGETVKLNATALAVLAPEGYELCDKDNGIEVTFNTREVRILVKAKELPAPANKNIEVKFMTDGKTVVGTRFVTVAEGETVKLNAAALAVLAPEGYELCDDKQSVTIKFNTKEVRVLVKAKEVQLPAVKEVPVKFMTNGTTVVGTSNLLVEEGTTQVFDAFKLEAMAPEGYVLCDKEQVVEVTFDTKEVRILVKATELPGPANKNVEIKFMTDGTTVVGTRFVTVAEGETTELSAAALAVLAPEGYELCDKENGVKVTFDTKEVRVLVKAIEVPLPAVKEVPVKFMTDGTTVVGTANIFVEEGTTQLFDAFKLEALAPEGYVLCDKEQVVEVAFDTKEVRVLVKSTVLPGPANKNVEIKFMTDGTTVVGTRYVTVAEGETAKLSAAALEVLAPEGYVLCDEKQSVKVTFDTKEVRVLVKSTKAPANKNVEIKFMTDGTTVVGTRYVTVAEGETAKLNAAALAVLAPKGYELCDEKQSVKVTFDTKEVRVLVKAIEVPLPAVKEVPVKFMTDGTTVVGTANVLIEEGTTQLFDAFKLAAMVPEGYVLCDNEQSAKVTFDTKEVRVLVKAIVVEPEGTPIVPIEPSTPVEPQEQVTTKDVTVNFVMGDQNVYTTTVKVAKELNWLSVKEFHVPGYEIVSKGRVRINADNTATIEVKESKYETGATDLVPLDPSTPVKPETEAQPEAPKKEEVKAETNKSPKTGDATNVMMAVVPAGVSLAAVLALLKKRAR